MLIVDLRQACDDKGLDHEGLNKKQLIDLLKSNDANDAGDDSNGADSGDVESVEESDYDSEIEIGPMEKDGTGGPKVTEAELEIRALRLKVELARAEQKAHRQQLDLEKARFEMEKERIKFRAENGLPPETTSAAISQRDLKALLPVMGEDHNALAFFHAYEKTLLIEKVDKSLWAKWLPACVNAKAGKVYTALSVDQCQQYEVVKRTILENFRLTARTYLEKFRGMRRTGQDSYTLFLNKLKEMLDYFMEAREVKDLDKMVEQVLLEQFVNGLPAIVRQFVEARQPTTASQAAEFADLQFETQHVVRANGPNQQKNGRWHKEQNVAATQPAVNDASSNAVSAGIQGSETRQPPARESYQAIKSGYRCNICNGFMHKAAQCPSKNAAPKPSNGAARNYATGGRQATTNGAASSSNTSSFVNRIGHTGRMPADANKDFICPIYLNNVETVAFRDTGASVTLVHSRFVTDECKRRGNIKIRAVNGSITDIPICEIPISSPRFNNGNAVVIVRAGYFDALEYDALLGNDMFMENKDLHDIVQAVKATPVIPAGWADTTVATSVEINSNKDMDVNLISNSADRNNQNPAVTAEVSQSATAATVNKEAVKDMTSGQDGKNVRVRGRHESLARRDYTQRNRSEGRPLISSARGRITQEVLTDANRQSGQDERPGRVIATNSDKVETQTTNSAVCNKQSEGGDQLPRQKAYSSTAQQEGSSVADNVTEIEFQRLSKMNLDSVYPSSPGQESKERADLANAQACDPALAHARSLARSGSQQFVIKNGLLFETRSPWTAGDFDDLLLVPQQYSQTVLHAAHDDIKGGCHFGIKKTLQKINAAGLTFPKARAVVKSWVSSCKQCQRTAARRTADRAPMHKIPVTGVAFEEIVIDVLGPQLKNTVRRNRYALVVVDAATRFVEILPLHNLKAKTVLDALLTGWCFRFGTPRVIRCDQQSSLMSQMWTSVFKKLEVDSKISVAYLHHTTGLAERWIRTVEHVLKCYVEEYPNNWDTSLPYVSFALNDAPCETTSFSAHELVYGRRLRSPLHVLRETWVEKNTDELALKKNVISYMTDLCNKLHSVNNLAQEHASEVQDRVKAWYDTKSRERVLEPGDKVLVLLPEDGRKMMAFWRGPFEVLKRIGEYNYEISMGQRKNTIMHINMLKKFNERIETVNTVITDDAEDGDEYDFPVTVEWTEGLKEFNIGGRLTADQQQQLRGLLKEFDDVFSDRPGRTNLITHSIKLSDPTPRSQAPYKVPVKMQERVELELDRLLATGLIVESDSPWAAPMVCVAKRNSEEVRICCNWKQLNAQTVDDAYPSADPNEILAKAAGSKFISTIDLRKGFWQVKLDEESIPCTSFRTQRGQYAWVVMGMGLKGASKTMQRLMDRILRGCSKWCGSLLDDLCIHSMSFDDHMLHLRDILTRLRKAGLTANTRKCQFLTSRIEVLGHTLEDGLIKPSMDKIKAIVDMQRPHTKSALRSFIGLGNYYRHFQPKFADTTFPLTELLKRNQPEKLNWLPVHQMAFEQVKTNLISRPVLMPPSSSKPFILQTDASDYGISAILAQLDDKGVEHVVSYSSRKLLPRERNYSVIEKECLAILFGLTKHDHWVYGQKITVYSDHRALQWLGSISQRSPRLARWTLLLQRYDLTTVWKKGADNTNADALSRL